MKKVFTIMTLFAALAIVTISCKDDKDPEEVSKNITGTDWAGYLTEEKKNGSSWEYNKQRNYAVIHFNGTSTGTAVPTSGTGYQVEFKNEFMAEKTGYSNFSWRLEGGELKMAYQADDWNDTYIDYNDATVTSTVFNGYMYDYTGNHRFRMELKANGSFDWSKWRE